MVLEVLATEIKQEKEIKAYREETTTKKLKPFVSIYHNYKENTENFKKIY